jgi:hypothetical protein
MNDDICYRNNVDEKMAALKIKSSLKFGTHQ